MAADKKRREPAPVAPVESGGLRFEAPFAGVPFGYQQDGGILVAWDIATRTVAWTQRIYRNVYDDTIESDKQDVFITDLQLADGGATLLVRNEQGEQYRLSLVGREAGKFGTGTAA
ncbi:hypothetical protein [uncultured Lamprocystis sp.]|jgi:hypothetical protein|uniref:hypothetical protein n=1 Tax=uncultured Lamprocystis sp. TaxID=543132 RepID=UPI0025D99443|nr:hypothetical protein [uncultured Lamprocystis sp.]